MNNNHLFVNYKCAAILGKVWYSKSCNYIINALTHVALPTVLHKKLPYTSKFSRRVISTVFADPSDLWKLSSRNFRIPYTRNSWSVKIVAAKCLEIAIRENCLPWKFGCVWYYMYNKNMFCVNVSWFALTCTCTCTCRLLYTLHLYKYISLYWLAPAGGGPWIFCHGWHCSAWPFEDAAQNDVFSCRPHLWSYS